MKGIFTALVLLILVQPAFGADTVVKDTFALRLLNESRDQIHEDLFFINMAVSLYTSDEALRDADSPMLLLAQCILP